LDKNYEEARTGGLAGALMALAIVLSDENRKRLIRLRLAERVRKELVWAQGSKLRIEALSLLGAASAFGVRIQPDGIPWPTEADLAHIVEDRAPQPGVDTIGHLQAQLWHGLREMARSLPNPLSVPPVVAEQVLMLWEASYANACEEGAPIWVIDSNRKMIDWLQACESVGWHLVPQ
jgi:hypothetical protein